MFTAMSGTLVVRVLFSFLICLNSVLAHETSTTTVTITSTTSVTYIVSLSTSSWVTTLTGDDLKQLATETTTSGATPTPTGDALYSGSAFQAAILNSTNEYRSHHQAKPLSWNKTLAEFAHNHAQLCLWQHSGGPYGENLAEGYANPTLAVDAWGDEEGKYNYAKAKFSETTGHFTQLVWKNTTSVGCGAVKCNNAAVNGSRGWLVVCEYSPRGNIVGLFKQSVSKPGISEDGVLGFASGAEPTNDRTKRLLVSLVAAYAILALLA